MADPLMARMKELEGENRRLKKIYAEERLKAEIVAESKKVVKPSHRREMAPHCVQAGHQSAKAACPAFGISQTCYRHEAKLGAENEVIAAWMVKV